MIGPVQDVEESRLDKPQRRLTPARIEPDQARIASELESADNSAGRQEPKHGDYSRCQPLECGNAGLPCAGPEFCSPGLYCFDKDHFGESATIYEAGVCAGAVDTRTACNARCMQAWTFSQGMVLDECTQQQATALCLDVCARYPAWDTCMNYFDMFNANDWRFRYMNCPTNNLCPTLGLRCGVTETALKYQINGCF